VDIQIAADLQWQLTRHQEPPETDVTRAWEASPDAVDKEGVSWRKLSTHWRKFPLTV
jgi:hypothetical protein